jgi:hypothetical protein
VHLDPPLSLDLYLLKSGRVRLEVLLDMDDKAEDRAQLDVGTSSVAADSEGPVQVTLDLQVPSGAQGTTGFLLFSNVHRGRVKEALQQQLSTGTKVTIAAMAKQIGLLWKLCDAEVKAAYAQAAKVVRSMAQHMDSCLHRGLGD